MSPDIGNFLFEVSGGLFLAMNIRRLLIDRRVAGVSVLPVVFYTLWGLWNMYYYPHLDQWWSFAGGFLTTGANVLWLSLYIYYTKACHR